MAETTYSYTVSTDFPQSKVNEYNFRTEITDSSISSTLISISRNGDDIDIIFDPALSTGDKTTFDGDTTGPAGGLIASHDPDYDIIANNLILENDTLTSPPGSPSKNKYYLVASPATGSWSGKEGRVANWTGSSWNFRKPTQGLFMWSKYRNSCLVVDVNSINIIHHQAFSQYEESESESTTTLTSYQTKLEMTTGDLPSGTYRIEYNFEISNSLVAILSSSRITVNGTTIGEPSFDCNGDYKIVCGVKQMVMSGVTSIKIEYKTALLGSAKIRRARLELRSISI